MTKRARDDGAEKVSDHIPKISRKIRACQGCQARKIKCGIEPGQSACSRCERLGIECIFNKTLQTLLDDENEWKRDISNQIQSLQSAVNELRGVLGIQGGSLVAVRDQGLSAVTTSFSQASIPVPIGASSHGDQMIRNPSLARADPVTAMTRENSPEHTIQGQIDDQDIVSAPMASLFEVTKLRSIRSDPCSREPPGLGRPRRQDFIAQGKIDLLEAEQLFETFRGTLSAYLWGGIALTHETFSSAHESSPLLSAAILAVTALHARDGGRSFDICYQVFLDLVSQSVLDRYHTLDDVRGLCVGAFWLSDVSWKLSGLAVRIATEMNLHQSCARALQNSVADIDKARLWYFLYVCDHHFSIAYGRPPVIHEDSVITHHAKFLELQSVTQADYRLHSQVGVFIILSRIYHIFGPDSSKIVANDEFETLRRFDADLSHWRDYWKTKLSCDKYIAAYPSKGVILHHHYARLQLFSLCLRGISPSTGFIISSERRVFINYAINSAFSALELILNDQDMRKAVVGVPLYLLTTIAYASMFLMKVQFRWRSAELDLSFDGVRNLIENVISLLDDNRGCVRHLAQYIGRGLKSMLQKLERAEVQENHQLSSDRTSSLGWDGSNGGQDWNQWMFNGEVVPQFEGQQYNPFGFLEVLHSQMPG